MVFLFLHLFLRVLISWMMNKRKKISHLWFYIIWMFVIENDGARQRDTYNQMLWYDKTNVRTTSFQFHFFSFFRLLFLWMKTILLNFVLFRFLLIQLKWNWQSNSIDLAPSEFYEHFFRVNLKFFFFSFLNETNETIWQLDKDESILKIVWWIRLSAPNIFG